MISLLRRKVIRSSKLLSPSLPQVTYECVCVNLLNYKEAFPIPPSSHLRVCVCKPVKLQGDAPPDGLDPFYRWAVLVKVLQQVKGVERLVSPPETSDRGCSPHCRGPIRRSSGHRQWQDSGPGDELARVPHDNACDFPPRNGFLLLLHLKHSDPFAQTRESPPRPLIFGALAVSRGITSVVLCFTLHHVERSLPSVK